MYFQALKIKILSLQVNYRHRGKLSFGLTSLALVQQKMRTFKIHGGKQRTGEKKV